MRVLLIGCMSTVLSLADTGGMQVIPSPETLGSNIVLNPSFETGGASPDNWTLSGAWTWSTDANCSAGSKCVSLTNQGASEVTFFQSLGALDQGVYEVLYKLKTTGTQGDFTTNARTRVYLIDETDGNTITVCGETHRLQGGIAAYTNVLWCDYALIMNEHRGHSHRIQIYAADIPSTGTLWVDEVSVKKRVRELEIYFTYPNYHGMVWPDQGNTITWKGIVDPPAGETVATLKYVVEILNSGGTVLDSVTDSTLEAISNDSRYKGYSVNDGSRDISALADGAYYVRGRLRRISDDALLYTYPPQCATTATDCYKIVKEATSVQRDSWKVWMDKYGRIIYDGKARFVWGSYIALSASCNTPFANCGGSCDGACTNADEYRKIGGGCVKSPPCDTPDACVEGRDPPHTRWNRDWGLNGSTLLKAMANWKMNTVIYYTPMSGNRIGSRLNTGSGNITNDGVSTTVTCSTSCTSGLAVNYWVKTGSCAVVAGNSCQNRQVASIVDATTFTVNTPFDPAITSVSWSYDDCGSYIVTDDQVAPWLTAIQDFGMWQLQIVDRYYHIAGAGTISSSGDRVTGVGTNFGVEVQMNRQSPGSTLGGDAIYSKGQVLAVKWILSPTELILTTTPSPALPSGSTYRVTIGSVPAWGQACQDLTETGLVQKLVNLKPIGNTNGFAGIYLGDEPRYTSSFQGTSRAQVRAKAFRDTNKGGIVAFVDGASPKVIHDRWKDIVDVALTDPYPLGANSLVDDVYFNVGSSQHGRSWGWPKRLNDATFWSRANWTAAHLWLQASQWPSSAYFKIQFVASLAAGVTGYMPWQVGTATSALSSRTQAQYDTWDGAARKIADLVVSRILDERILDASDGPAGLGQVIASSGISSSNIMCTTRSMGAGAARRDLLACINKTNTSTATTFTLVSGRIPAGAKVLRYWDGVQITPTGDAFSDTLVGLSDVTTPEDAGQIYIIETPSGASIRATN